MDEAVPGTTPVHAAEERLHYAVPRHLCELVDSADQQRRQQSVQLLVDDDRRDSLASGLFGGELALTELVRTGDLGALQLTVDLVVTELRRNLGATPGAVRQLVG